MNIGDLFQAWWKYIPDKLFCSVVKEELSDDEAHLPCFNGRVVSWVSDFIISVLSLQ